MNALELKKQKSLAKKYKKELDELKEKYETEKAKWDHERQEAAKQKVLFSSQSRHCFLAYLSLRLLCGFRSAPIVLSARRRGSVTRLPHSESLLVPALYFILLLPTFYHIDILN